MIESLFLDDVKVAQDWKLLLDYCAENNKGIYFCRRTKTSKIYLKEGFKDLDLAISEKMFQELLKIFHIGKEDYRCIYSVGHTSNNGDKMRTMTASFSQFKGPDIDISIQFSSN